MLKYQKKGLCKALSMLLAVVMLLTAQIGTTQAYALEGEQPTVTDVQDELPLGASEETKKNGVLDSGMQPEVSDSPKDASSFEFSPFEEGITPPAFAGDYPNLGTEQTEGSKEIEVLVKGILPEGETSMGLGYVLLADNASAPTAEQIKSSHGNISGVTFITWGQQNLDDTATTIMLTGAQDDTDYDFYAVFWTDDAFSDVEHLDVKTPAAGSGDPGPCVLAPLTGLLWDTADDIKAKWDLVANATSYTVTLWKEGHSTMLVQYPELTGTEVSFQSIIAGNTGNYYFTVQAIATDYTSSLMPASPSYPYIAPLYGNVTIGNMSSKIGDTLTGSLVNGNNTGTLHYKWKAGGELVGADAASYTVTAADQGKTITLEITSSVETGARTSAATTAVLLTASTSTTIDVCSEIELINRLNSAQSGDTIRLTEDIMRSENNSSGNSPALIIKGKNITLDLNGKSLSIYNAGYGPGLRLEAPSTNERNATQLHVTGGGTLTISSLRVGLSVDRSKFSADASVVVDINGSFTVGIGGSLADVDIQKGSVMGNDGISLAYNSNVTVKGPVKATTNVGVNLSNSKLYPEDRGCIVCVDSIEANGRGISMDGGEVTVDGTITAPTYIQFKGSDPTKIGDNLPITTKDGYRTYQHETAGIVWVKGEASSDTVCEIDGTKYATLDEALAAVNSGEKNIKLLRNIDYPKGLAITSKHIIFDVGPYKLNITNSSGPGLDVSGTAGRVSLISTTGELNVAGTDYAVTARDGGNAIVTNATATKDGGYGIFASGKGTSVNVKGNVQGTAEGVYVTDGARVYVEGNVSDKSRGVYATGMGSTGIVSGKVTARDVGVFAESGGKVSVFGGIEAVTCGARISNGGNVDIVGSVTVTGADGIGAYLLGTGKMIMAIDGTLVANHYIKIKDVIISKESGVLDAGYVGYLKYADGYDRVVWVKASLAPTDRVCEIGEKQYATLDEALTAVLSGERIKLLRNIDYPKGIAVTGKHIIFDVGPYTLNITNDDYDGIGLDVSGTAGRVSLASTTGELNVAGAVYGVRAWNGGSVTVTNVAKNMPTCTAAIIANGAGTEITVKGNVQGANDGVYAANKASIIVEGSVIGRYRGAIAYEIGSTVIVRGNVSAPDFGIYAENGGNILAHGAIEAVTCGARISNGGTITAKKEITVTGADGVGAQLTGGGSGGGRMTIDGEITATNYINLSGTIKLKSDGVEDSTKPGYTKYTDGDDRVVWVKAVPSTDITSSFTDLKFLAAVRSELGKGGSDPIYTADVAGITDLGIVGKGITNLAGIEHFTALITLDCSNNALKTLDVRHLTQLDILYCSDNLLTGLVLNGSADYSHIDARNNYMENVSAVTGKNITWDDYRFRYSPQKAPQITYILSVQSGTGGGNYTKDSTVTIIANTAPAGHRFKEWKILPAVTFTGGTNKTDATAKFIMPAQVVTATATYEALPASHYAIIVQNDGNGTASANVNSAAEDTEIILTATPNSNYRFKEWQVVSGGVSIANNKLTMPGADVIVKAIFEPIPVASVIVTFNLNGGTRTGGGELTQTIPSGSSAIAPTVTRSGYTFISWDKAITNVTSNLTVTANWSHNGSSGSEGGSDGGSGGAAPTTPITATTPGKTPDRPVTAAAPVTATAGANGTASASIPEKSITDAIAKAQADAKAQGKTANGISVGLNVTMPKGSTSLTATLTQNSLNNLVSAGVFQLELNGAPVSLGFDLNALKEIQKQSNGNISITIAPATGLSKKTKVLLGNRPVYSITISCIKDGKTVNITSLGSGSATLSIPYTPGKNEAVGYLFGLYVDTNGKVQRIDSSAYDANSGSLLIHTSHFSMYGVGYTVPSAKFTDIGTHWGKEAIDYVVGRGLLSGTSETAFAPNTAMTRGILVMALGRLAGVDVKAYTTNSFTDVKADSTFRPYIEWAYKKGIVQEIGSQTFAPDRAITREEIAVIFVNYAKATNYKLPVTRETIAYDDASSIGSTYNTAVTAMQQAGIMMGGMDNRFNPKSSAICVEVSAMLYRYVKLTIDSTTTQGWALNDAGQYLYYKDGKALTDTQTIDGAKYFFNTDGTLKTGWVKDGDNWRYYFRNKATAGWLDISDKRYYFTKDGWMVSGKWLQIDSKWYYFYADGSLAKDTKVDGHEVGLDGERKTK
jgi:glucan-binding YG repeat protein